MSTLAKPRAAKVAARKLLASPVEHMEVEEVKIVDFQVKFNILLMIRGFTKYAKLWPILDE